MVETQEELRDNLADACALIVEGLSVGPRNRRGAQAQGRAEIRCRPAAHRRSGLPKKRGIAVLSQRRRANIACAELRSP